MSQLETTILKNIIQNDEFMRKALPFVRVEYFTGPYRTIFVELARFVGKYNKMPTADAFAIELETVSMNDDMSIQVQQTLPDLFAKDEEPVNQKWLTDTTEKWCQDRAIFNAIMESISIIDGKHESLTKNALPEILQKALAVSFDTNVGHDYIAGAEARYDFYHLQESKVPFDLEIFNQITKGGLSRKTLNIVLAGTGVGKSLFMCHMAANALMQGRNVLYITMEMAEERIAERIDANLLNVPIDQLEFIPKSIFTSKVFDLAKKTAGQLIIKEYPTGAAHAGHIRALLNELNLKKGFVPDLIFIDYLNICASSRVKGMGGTINSYTYVKAIAEELRGLAVEFDVPIVSATQTTRSGFTNSDPGLEDTSESFGLPATADLMFVLVSTDELAARGQMMVKQLKNRYSDLNKMKKFLLTVDKARMKLGDVPMDQQDLIVEPAAYKPPLGGTADLMTF